MSDAATAHVPPWPPERMPTGAEWLEWLDAQPQELRVRVADQALALVQLGGTCVETGHADQGATITTLSRRLLEAEEELDGIYREREEQDG